MAVVCDVDNDVTEAYGAFLTHDRAAARSGLDRAEADLGCTDGLVLPAALARLWLVDGALLAASDDPDATLSLAAAHRVAPEVWLPKLGDRLKQRWLAAKVAGTGTVTLDVGLTDRTAAIDGLRWSGAAVPAGLHAIQVADGSGRILFGKIVYVGAGTATTVATGLPPERSTWGAIEAPVAVAEPAPPPSREHRIELPAIGLRVAAGAAMAVGQRLVATSGTDIWTEPGAKVVVPVELAATCDLGEVASLGTGWARGSVGSGWLVGGPYLSASLAGELRKSPLQADIALAGGITRERIRAGLSSGIQWPGRLSERVLADYAVNGPWSVEGRLGFNFATDRPIEPALELLVGWSLR